MGTLQPMLLPWVLATVLVRITYLHVIVMYMRSSDRFKSVNIPFKLFKTFYHSLQIVKRVFPDDAHHIDMSI